VYFAEKNINNRIANVRVFSESTKEIL